jgi:hypothetical protein
VDVSPGQSSVKVARPSQQQGNNKAASKVAQEAVKAKEAEMAAADASELRHANRPPAPLTSKVLRQKLLATTPNVNLNAAAGTGNEFEGMY